MVSIIKSKADAEAFVRNLDEFEYADPQICVINGGTTIIKKIDENDFTTFSFGQNWWDQQEEHHDFNFIVKKIWETRKAVNRAIRDQEEDSDY